MVQGELDITSRRHLADMAGILAGLRGGVDFDLSRVRFIDSAGWDALTHAVQTLEAAGMSARVSRQSDAVRRLRALLDASVLAPAA